MPCRRLLTAICITMTLLGYGCGKPKSGAPVPPDNKEAPLEPVAPGDPTRSAIPSVGDLKHKSADRRWFAIREIAQQSPDDAVPIFLELLSDKSFVDGASKAGEPNSPRETAMIGLLKLGPTGEAAAIGKAAPTLTAALKDPDAGVREHALLALSLLGTKARAASGDVLNLCQDESPEVRRSAFETLSRIGGASADAYALMLDNKSPQIVYDAAKALNSIRPLPLDVLDLVIEAIRKPPVEGELDEAGLARVELADAIGSYGANAATAIPALIDMLKTCPLMVSQVQRQLRPRPR